MNKAIKSWSVFDFLGEKLIILFDCDLSACRNLIIFAKLIEF